MTHSNHTEFTTRRWRRSMFNRRLIVPTLAAIGLLAGLNLLFGGATLIGMALAARNT